MRSQLTLIDNTNSNGSTGSRFRLDDRTVALGREGLAAARAALAEVAARRQAAEERAGTSDRQAA